MALLKYFKKVSQDDISVASSDSKLNAAEENAVKQQLFLDAPEAKKRRGKYGAYDAFQRAEIAKWGIAHGIRPAARKYSVPESTVRGLVKSYNKERKERTELEQLPRKHRGAKTLLPENIDEKVIAMIKSMRAAGCVVNYNIAISIAKGIVLANDRSLLKENGGTLEFHYTWCQSIFRRLGFSKRRATTAKQPVSPGFLKEIRFTFHRSIKEVVTAYDVPDDLIINIDQTPLPFVLISKYTMDKTNEKFVPISDSADYRQITGTFSVTASGKFLPIQLIYQGKTDRCHPKFRFPKEFQVTHTENHWSNETKAIELVNRILIPYVKQIREELGFRATKQWVLIADVFKAHWTDAVKKIISDNNGTMIPVPNNMTSYLQPLDLTVNRSCKAFLRNQAQTWYSEQVQAQIEKGIQPDKVSVDLRISVLKPLHAKWIVQFYDYMQSNKDIVVKGWQRSGVSAALEEPQRKEDPFEL